MQPQFWVAVRSTCTSCTVYCPSRTSINPTELLSMHFLQFTAATGAGGADGGAQGRAGGTAGEAGGAGAGSRVGQPARLPMGGRHRILLLLPAVRLPPCMFLEQAAILWLNRLPLHCDTTQKRTHSPPMLCRSSWRRTWRPARRTKTSWSGCGAREWWSTPPSSAGGRASCRGVHG